MTTQRQGHAVTFLVINAMDAPHGGRILRLRHKEGHSPRVRELKGARMRAVSPDGEERTVEIEGFALFGGRPTDKRLERTGRVDVRILDDESRGGPIGFDWELSGPLG